jgi:hypothetical protein
LVFFSYQCDGVDQLHQSFWLELSEGLGPFFDALLHSCAAWVVASLNGAPVLRDLLVYPMTTDERHYHGLNLVGDEFCAKARRCCEKLTKSPMNGSSANEVLTPTNYSAE